MTTKDYCSECKRRDVPLLKSGLKTTTTGKVQYMICRECNTKRCRKYRSTEEGIRKVRVVRKRATEKYPEKKRARQVFRTAVGLGNIKRKSCEFCGEKKTDGHHPNYSKPLEVIWLCRTHHADMHAGRINLLPEQDKPSV